MLDILLASMNDEVDVENGEVMGSIHVAALPLLTRRTGRDVF